MKKKAARTLNNVGPKRNTSCILQPTSNLKHVLKAVKQLKTKTVKGDRVENRFSKKPLALVNWEMLRVAEELL